MCHREPQSRLRDRISVQIADMTDYMYSSFKPSSGALTPASKARDRSSRLIPGPSTACGLVCISRPLASTSV